MFWFEEEYANGWIGNRIPRPRYGNITKIIGDTSEEGKSSGFRTGGSTGSEVLLSHRTFSKYIRNEDPKAYTMRCGTIGIGVED